MISPLDWLMLLMFFLDCGSLEGNRGFTLQAFTKIKSTKKVERTINVPKRSFNGPKMYTSGEKTAPHMNLKWEKNFYQ